MATRWPLVGWAGLGWPGLAWPGLASAKASALDEQIRGKGRTVDVDVPAVLTRSRHHVTRALPSASKWTPRHTHNRAAAAAAALRAVQIHFFGGPFRAAPQAAHLAGEALGVRFLLLALRRVGRSYDSLTSSVSSPRRRSAAAGRPHTCAGRPFFAGSL